MAMHPAGRLVPELAFPPYSYVPGQAPHPKSDPAGHSYGVAPHQPAAVDLVHWPRSKVYLYGLDLLNGGFYWEAHEQLEGLWLAAGRAGTTADFLKALIQLAVAGVKALEGRPLGVQQHAHRAAELFRKVMAEAEGTAPRTYLGLEPDSLARSAERLAEAAAQRSGELRDVLERMPALCPTFPDEQARNVNRMP